MISEDHPLEKIKKYSCPVCRNKQLDLNDEAGYWGARAFIYCPQCRSTMLETEKDRDWLESHDHYDVRKLLMEEWESYQQGRES